ncbi:MAG: hypothetical protein A2506_02800 [Elusimicrobia bacterium RIFOXYD12_FULL_66_9]|nr:MAG: hypothetical protein A2506_02800 [Elusimicrobia bacterium RIFOXYD12_FULL_66_9]
MWAPWRVDSEYRRLEAIVLHRPGAEIGMIREPNKIQHLARIETAALAVEFRRIAAAFRKLGVKVYEIEHAFEGRPWPRKHNLMFVRDLFLNTPEGAIVSRMASVVRAGEEKHAARTLADLGIPILRTISGRGLFEGADALWLDARTVLCGVGNRTNAEGFRQLRETLGAQGVETFAVELPRGIQHLLGILQVVDSHLALLRCELASKKIAAFLKRKAIRVVPVRETDETRQRQGMNIVTAAPRTILMPQGCPELKRQYLKAGIRVAAELDIRQLLRGAGGLACAVGILSRKT